MHSGIVISQTDTRPMYLQIMEQVKQRVAVGEWAPGAEIPSIRQLAMALRVSVITIKRAYLELEREGVILTQQRLCNEELAERLDQVARLGELLGLSTEEIALRLREASKQLDLTRTGSIRLEKEIA